jgi:hypothetical protein
VHGRFPSRARPPVSCRAVNPPSTAIEVSQFVKQLPHLATKAEVAGLRADMVAGFADMPGKTYMWGILAVLLAAYACGLAGLAVLK